MSVQIVPGGQMSYTDLNSENMNTSSCLKPQGPRALIFGL